MFMEINVPWTPELKDKATKIGQKGYKQFKLVGASRNEPAIGHYRPGGTMTAVTGKLIGGVII